MIVDESSYIIETAYRTWFHETVSEQDRQLLLDTVRAFQNRIRQQFSAQKEAIRKIDVIDFAVRFHVDSLLILLLAMQRSSCRRSHNGCRARVRVVDISRSRRHDRVF